MKDGIKNSKVLLACVNSYYLSQSNCIFELQFAKTSAKIPIITIPIQSNIDSWCIDTEHRDLCGLTMDSNLMYVDFSSIANEPWGTAEGIYIVYIY